ncbi:hypothetical protein SCANM63S_03424 [Streptomyces canarius]
METAQHVDAERAVGGVAHVTGDVDALGAADERLDPLPGGDGRDGEGVRRLGRVRVGAEPGTGEQSEQFLPGEGAGHATAGHGAQAQAAEDGGVYALLREDVVHGEGERRLADRADALPLLLRLRQVLLQDLADGQAGPFGDLLVQPLHHRVCAVQFDAVRLGAHASAQQVAQRHVEPPYIRCRTVSGFRKGEKQHLGGAWRRGARRGATRGPARVVGRAGRTRQRVASQSLMARVVVSR